jgi:hypothetical protein
MVSSLRPDRRVTGALGVLRRQDLRPRRQHAALHRLANRWHCLNESVTYDEAVHVANRNHAANRNCSLRRAA